MDRISKKHRSWNMSRIRSKDTAPERAVRSALHRLGFRFRLQRKKSLPGRPDVVLTRHRTAVFVHGCFWHRHTGCQFAYTPKTRPTFWLNKFSQNMIRDRRACSLLRKTGWRPLIIWECQTSDPDHLRRLLLHKLGSVQSRSS